MNDAERIKILDFILGVEGGYSNDPRDSGGETKYGIADMADGRRDGMTDVDGDGRPDTRIVNLTLEQAKEIYIYQYVRPFDDLPWPVSLVVADAAVQHGQLDAVKMLQRAINALAGRQVVMVDGRIGPITLTVQRAHRPRELALRIIIERLEHYAHCKSWPAHGRGWTLRMAEIGRAIDWHGGEVAA